MSMTRIIDYFSVMMMMTFEISEIMCYSTPWKFLGWLMSYWLRWRESPPL